MTQLLIDRSVSYYLAGPMSGIPEYNYPLFERACIMLREAQIDVLSPHEVPWPEDYKARGEESLWEYMMQETRELLERAGGIILLPSWYHSRGALEELKIVREAKLPTWFFGVGIMTLIPMWDRER